jgi:hypothetical protein
MVYVQANQISIYMYMVYVQAIGLDIYLDINVVYVQANQRGGDSGVQCAYVEHNLHTYLVYQSQSRRRTCWLYIYIHTHTRKHTVYTRGICRKSMKEEEMLVNIYVMLVSIYIILVNIYTAYYMHTYSLYIYITLYMSRSMKEKEMQITASEYTYIHTYIPGICRGR